MSEGVVNNMTCKMSPLLQTNPKVKGKTKR